MPEPPLPTFADVAAAARRLQGQAQHTPVLRSRTLDERMGAHFFFKCENLQRTGAFKFRGACNALAQLSPQQKQAGVVTFSSGNHAQAMALAARLLGIPATIVMPQDAPAVKLAATRGYGARIVLYDRYRDDREQLARDLVRAHGSVLIPPYDHSDIIAGQGTAALELLQETGPLDALFAPLGGGGLLAGSILAARQLAPDCAVYGVEPETGDDGLQSLRAGRVVRIQPPHTIADGAQTLYLGERTFPIIRDGASGIVLAPDSALVACMRFFAQRMKLLVEPTGCLGLAGALPLRQRFAGKRVGIIVSGGNIDLQRFAQLLAAADDHDLLAEHPPAWLTPDRD